MTDAYNLSLLLCFLLELIFNFVRCCVHIVGLHHFEPALVHKCCKLCIHGDLCQQLVAELVSDLCDMALAKHVDFLAAIGTQHVA